MRHWLRVYPGAAFAFLAAAIAINARPQSTAPVAHANVVACRVLETHTSDQPPIITVVFHHRDREDGPVLGSLLLENSGAIVEIQIGKDGPRQTGRVFRLKSCFGRGLLLLPTGATAPKDREVFTIKFPSAHDAGTQQ
jgi:hypothetical protein